MSRKVARGEGADGLLIKTLTECIGRLGAIDPKKAPALRETFHAELMKNPRVAESPKDWLRHEGAIIQRMFTNKQVEVAPPEPAKPKDDIIIPTSLDDLGLSDFDIEPDPVNNFTSENGPLAAALEEWATSRRHPFVRTVTIDGKKYAILGTAVVHYPDGRTVNINATTGNAKKIRECDETVLVHFNGRPVTMSKDVAGGTAFFVWLCHYTEGRVFRFWMNRSEHGTRKDDPRGAIRVLITSGATGGYRKVAA